MIENAKVVLERTGVNFRKKSVTVESMCTCIDKPLRTFQPAHKRVVRLTDNPNMTIGVYRGRQTTTTTTNQVCTN